jgi:hypothetical protein
LADRFLPCEAGLRSMYYDFRRKVIFVPSSEGGVLKQVSLRHQIEVKVRRM